MIPREIGWGQEAILLHGISMELEKLAGILSSGAGGGIQTISGSGSITVDNTDPLNPIISSTAVASITAGRNMTVDNTDPLHPVISTTADDIVVVSTYADLPAPGLQTDNFFWVSTATGSKWIPASLGGTFHDSGLYYSNGVTWEYLEVPYQATQAEVDAGIVPDKFVSPLTLKNATSLTFTADIPVVLSAGKTLGKYVNGQTIPAIGKTAQQVITDIALEYLTPTFATFSITGQSTLIEVGVALSGSKNFTWTFTNPTNITASTMSILDVTAGNVVLASGLSLTPPASVNIGTIVNTAPVTQSWRGRATNTLAATFDSALFTVNSIYPVFFGTSAAPPVADQALINSGSKSVVTSTGTVTLTFGASSQYIWFAIPQTSTDKTKWFVDALNNGNIGTVTDLFNNDVIVSINSPTALWTGVNYRIYLSNFATSTTGTMQLQN